MPKRAAFAGCLQYRKAARFSEQVARYFEVFGKENVLVGLQSEFEEEPQKFLQKVLRFLEVDADVELPVERKNDSTSLVGTHHFDLKVSRAISRLPGGQGLKKAFAKSLQGRYRKLADKLFAPMSEKKINSILEEELLEDFEPEVARLGKLLERNLSEWNEPQFPQSENEHHHHH